MNTDLHELLNQALDQYDSFGLLWRSERQKGAPGWEIQEAFRPFLIKSEMTDEWPGTQIYYGKELYCTYALVPASLALLQQATELFSLFGDHGPEDLAFFKEGRTMFTSISHEEESWYAT